MKSAAIPRARGRATCTLAATLALAGVLGAGPAAVGAAPIAYSFAGHVEADEADRGWDRFSGEFRFDTDVPDAIADTGTGAYAHAGPPWGMRLRFYSGDSEVHSVTLEALFNVLISNDLAAEDQFGLLAQDADPAHHVSMTLWDFAASVFGSDALPQPVGGLGLAQFSWSQLQYGSADGFLSGRLDALACTQGCGVSTQPTPALPEPGTWALVLGGLAGLTTLRRRPRAGGVPAPRTPARAAAR